MLKIKERENSKGEWAFYLLDSGEEVYTSEMPRKTRQEAREFGLLFLETAWNFDWQAKKMENERDVKLTAFMSR